MAATAATGTGRKFFGLFRPRKKEKPDKEILVKLNEVAYHSFQTGQAARIVNSKTTSTQTNTNFNDVVFFAKKMLKKHSEEISYYLKAAAVATLGVAIRCLLNKII